MTWHSVQDEGQVGKNRLGFLIVARRCAHEELFAARYRFGRRDDRKFGLVNRKDAESVAVAQAAALPRQPLLIEGFKGAIVWAPGRLAKAVHG